MTGYISLQDISPYKYNYAQLKLSYTCAFTKLTFIHPTAIINDERAEDCQSQLKMFFYIHTHNLVTTCFCWNRPSSGNTKYQNCIEGLMQL
jgi:hypothetical protein